MKKYAFFLIAVCMQCVLLPQQGSARVIKDMFISMPDSLMPMLDENARKDLADICLSGMTTALPNEWGGTSMLQKLTDSYLLLREDSDGAVTTEMVLLPAGKDTIVCMVRTLHLPQPASEVLFFSSQWKQLNTARIIKLPTISEFAPNTDANLKEINPDRIVPVEFVQIALQEAQDETHPAKLIFSTNTSPATISYSWNGKKFRRIVK